MPALGFGQAAGQGPGFAGWCQTRRALKAVLSPLNYCNLDAVPEFAGLETTTKFLIPHIFTALAEAAQRGDLGPGGEEVAKIRVTLHESPMASARVEGEVNNG